MTTDQNLRGNARRGKGGRGDNRRRSSTARGANSADVDRQDVHTHDDDNDRANPIGAYIAALGAIITLVSVWLGWVSLGEGESEASTASGYEADGVVPLMGYLAVGFAVALLYATVRADRRQHRGLSLASMAVGLASLLWAVSYLIDPISTIQLADNVTTEIGVWIAILGTLLWTVGSFVLANEPEGDIDRTRRTVERARVESRPEPTRSTQHVERHDVDDVRHVDTRPADTHSDSTRTATRLTGDETPRGARSVEEHDPRPGRRS